MKPDAGWSAFLPALGLLAFVAVAVVLADRQGLHPVVADLRYFHARDDGDAVSADLGYASMQVKGVAAHRHVSPQEVRRLMERHTVPDDDAPGRRRVVVPALNAALDERWPMQ